MAKTILKGDDAIQLWLKGKGAWNKWAEENPESDVDFSEVDFGKIRESEKLEEISFDGFQFPTGRVSFAFATFGKGKVSFFKTAFGAGGVRFAVATFDKGKISFHSARFGEAKVSFRSATFGEGIVTFRSAHFGKGDVAFYETRFGDGIVEFNYADFGKGEVSFTRATFGKGNVDFHEATFGEGDVSFIRAHFNEGHVSFNRAHFGKGHVSFSSARFGKGILFFTEANFDDGDVSFDGATFSDGDVSFTNARFGEGTVSFNSTTIKAGHIDLNRIDANGILDFTGFTGVENVTGFSFRHASLNDSLILPAGKFGCVPDLRNSKIAKQITFHDMKTTLKRHRRGWRKFWRREATDPEDASRLRRLKELAEANKDHHNALAYHADEMRAQRWAEVGFLPSVLDAVFSLVSNYGQSILRPIIGWLIMNTGLFGFYSVSSGWDWSKAYVFTVANSLPYLSSSRGDRIKSLEALNLDDIPNIVSTLTFAHGTLTVVFLFLVGLGLRNRFRI